MSLTSGYVGERLGWEVCSKRSTGSIIGHAQGRF